MSATLDPSAPLDNTMGAMIIGVIFSAVLHGICLMQAVYYFSRYKTDPLYIKCLVTVTVTFDATHLCLVTHCLYHYLITGFHNPDNLRFLVWSILMEALFTGVNGALVQSFFTMRVWRLSHGNWFLTGLIAFLIVCCAGCGTGWVVVSMRLQTYEQLLRISPLTITINALSTTIDILIASSLCILLQRARTGFKKTDTVINRLIVFVVNTGMLTTLCATASLISLVASPHTLIYATFYFCIGRLYSNSLLATLNARKGIASDVDDVTYMVTSMPTKFTHPAPSSANNISIQIETTRNVQDDVFEMSSKERGDKKSGVDGGESDISTLKSRPL